MTAHSVKTASSKVPVELRKEFDEVVAYTGVSETALLRVAAVMGLAEMIKTFGPFPPGWRDGSVMPPPQRQQPSPSPGES
jgi:hypothetical protein